MRDNRDNNANINLESEIKSSVEMIKSRVGETGKVIVLVSGGVDSMVTSALLLKALPAENIYAIHVDHGFMRKNESSSIHESINKLGFKNLAIVNAQEAFLNERVEIGEIDGKLAPPLCEVKEPELKRKIVGNMFIEIVKKAADTFNLDYNATFIAQGTLKPDLLESGNKDVSKSGNRVKTHHNDVDIVRKARERGMIIETNWNWYKEDVRQIARILGLNEETASRQPFPGPGLAVRQICANKEVTVSDDMKNKFDEFMRDKTLNGVIAPILSVGVDGDMRSYKNLCVLSQSCSDSDSGGLYTDFDTASKLSAEITNNNSQLNFITRCVYVLNRADIRELTRNDLTMAKKNTDILREIDYIITSGISKWLSDTGKSSNAISQYFGILVPISTVATDTTDTANKKYSAVIRAVLTSDFMTAKSAIPGKDIPVEVIRGIADRIEAELPEIDLVLYDMTDKPPATVEWE